MSCPWYNQIIMFITLINLLFEELTLGSSLHSAQSVSQVFDFRPSESYTLFKHAKKFGTKLMLRRKKLVFSAQYKKLKK